jgi:DNA-binding LacI/PurR family transcriptional regulator
VASDPAEAYWQFSKSTGIHEVLSATIKEFDLTGRNPLGEHPDRAMVRSLLDKTPSFVNLLRDHAPTALIALNDHMAREYYYWFTAVGLNIPKDFSIISFDNLFASMFFPITTIDFGFERLGYQAAHIIIGDIPIRANRYGNIPGPCTLIDRGSLGPPGDLGVIRRLLDA